MDTTTLHLGRRAFGLAALSALALTACGAKEVAGFEAGGTGGGASDGGGAASTTPAAPDLPPLDPGFLLEDFTKDVTVTATLQPRNRTVVTPTGTLTLAGVQELTSVPAEAVGLEAETDEDGEALDFGPADGQVLRALDLTFAPLSTDPFGDPLPATDLSLRAGGAQDHLAEITGEYSARLLVSVPADGSAMLVVSSEGHDQLVDVLTGERQEDDIAAAYYRAGTVQEPHHTFPVSVDPIPVSYNGEEDSEVTTDLSFQATTLTLTAWTAGNGWAEPGGAWLVVDWISDISVATEIPGLVTAGDFRATASVTVDGETTTDEVHDDKLTPAPSTNEESRTLVVPVAADITTATVSMSGGLIVTLDGPGGAYALEGSGDLTFATDELTVEFPLGDGGSAPSDGGGAEPSDGGGS